MSHHLDEETRGCIEACEDCRSRCLETVNHCLSLGGKHASAAHIRSLLDCAQICDTAASFMLRGSEEHGRVCAVCAEICRICEESCLNLAGGDQTMEQCAEACRHCASSCDRMAAIAA